MEIPSFLEPAIQSKGCKPLSAVGSEWGASRVLYHLNPIAPLPVSQPTRSALSGIIGAPGRTGIPPRNPIAFRDRLRYTGANHGLEPGGELMWGVNPVTVFFMLVVALWLINSINVVRGIRTRRHLQTGAPVVSTPRAPALSSSSGPSIALSGYPCEPSLWTFPPRTSSPATTSRRRSMQWSTFAWSTPPGRWSRLRTISMPPPSFRRPPCVSVLGEVMLDDLLSRRETLNIKAPGHPGQADRPLGDQGLPGRSQGSGPAAGDAAGHGQAGRGGA